MKGLPATLFCIALAGALIACGQDKGQDKGKATTETKAATQPQSKAPAQKKASTKAQKKPPTHAQKKAPTHAQKKQQDRMGDCNKQANLRNMKGEDRKRFMSTCLSG